MSKICILPPVNFSRLLFRLGFDFAAAPATIATDKFSAVEIKRIILDHVPFMKTALTEGFAPVLIFWPGLLKLQDIVHGGRLSVFDDEANAESMAENLNQVLIGARGWSHPGWQSNFYPEDLPEDWRLAYYANIFSMVVIPEPVWAQLSDIAALRDECADEFRFVVELPLWRNAAGLSAQVERLQQLGEQCAGVILHPEQENSDENFPANIPRYREGEAALIKIQAGVSLKTLRAQMEKALQMQTILPVLFIVEGEPPDIELLRNMQTLFELL